MNGGAGPSGQVATPGALHDHQAQQEAAAAARQAPPAPPLATTWDGLRGGLPEHHAEVLAAHQGAPSIAEQSQTHGAPLPAPDHGISDQAKYAG